VISWPASKQLAEKVESEDLRGTFIAPAASYLTSSERDGPSIKGSRASMTAVNSFAALIFWFILHQGKMNRKLAMGYHILIVLSFYSFYSFDIVAGNYPHKTK